MKTLSKLGLLFIMSFLVTSCGDGNVLDKVNPFSSSSDGIVAGGAQIVGGTAIQQISQAVPCVTSQGFGNSNRIPYGPFTITGGDGSGYQGQIFPGSNFTGNPTGTFVGVSGSPQGGTSGDLIEVISYDSGTARVMLYMCEEYPLIFSGRPLVGIQGLPGSKLVIDTQTGCNIVSTGDVRSYQISVTMGPVSVGNGAQISAPPFNVSFSSYKYFAPQLCNNSF